MLAIGFGTTVAMWTVGYFCRLFGDAVPAPLLFALLIACQLVGGIIAGRYAADGLRTAALAGLITGLLNLLIVGSMISGDTPNEIKSGALLWVPGTLLVGVVLGVLGASFGRTIRGDDTHELDWPGLFPAIASVATFVLLGAGGLVTGFDEGLAVVDWPNTEGYNMFLYPLARMTGGVYLEHAHRLLGSLVGLTTLVLAFHVQFTDRNNLLRTVTWFVLGMVIVQGILGGLRVTGRFTFSTELEHTAPSIVLAIIHGVFGQVVFGGLIVVAVLRSRAWKQAMTHLPAPAVSTDRVFGITLIIALIVQLVLGALVRHFTWALHMFTDRYGLNANPAELIESGQWALTLHITMAVFVTLLSVAVGVRVWGLYRRMPVFRQLGLSMLVLIAVQLTLGIVALIVSGDDSLDRRPTALDVTITTLHQIVAAALLAWAIMIVLWTYRLLDDRMDPAATSDAGVTAAS